MSTLNITNGDATREAMLRAGITGEILCWRDVLHEGPVPWKGTLSALSAVRAAFIAGMGWGDSRTTRRTFTERDRGLARCGEYRRVVLWFEHDLYDQLQLVQILDWMADRDLGATALELICVDRYLAELDPAALAALRSLAVPVSGTQLALARRAWNAFRSTIPCDWAALLDEDASPLPFLKAAVLRHCEQFPALRTGLNRSERQILEAVASGHASPADIFHYNQRADGVRFMGDTVFWSYIEGLCAGGAPLLRTDDGAPFEPRRASDREHCGPQILVLTSAGRAVLAAAKDWRVEHSRTVWRGGVELTAANSWRWDAERRRLVRMN